MVALTASAALVARDVSLLRWTGMQSLTLSLFGLAFLSSYWTVAPDAYETYFRSQWPYFALYFGLGPILCNHPKSLSDATRTTLVLGIPIMVGLAFFCEWTGRGIRLSTPVEEGGKLRHYSPPLAAASCAAVVALLTISTLSKRTSLRLFGFAVVLLCTYIIVLTQSRGQLLAFCFVASLVYPATHRATSGRGLLQLMVIMAVLILATYAAFHYAGEAAFSRWQTNSMDRALEGRTLMMQRLFTTWIHSDLFAWILGLGVSSSFRISRFYVHNVPIEVLCELGLVGATLFMIFCWKTFRNSLMLVWQTAGESENRSYAIGFVGTFLFLSILTLKEGTLYAIPHLFFVGILIDRFAIQTPQQIDADYWSIFIDPENGSEEPLESSFSGQPNHAVVPVDHPI